jgi:transposase
LLVESQLTEITQPARAATSDEVKDLRREASALKEVVVELTLENRLLKKTAIGVGEDGA